LSIRKDISDRKQAELELQKNTDRLALALNSGAIGCWEWDIQRNLLVWDDRMYELYGELQQIPIKPATKETTSKAQSRYHNDETN
jgi:PAS domain-containing protein